MVNPESVPHPPAGERGLVVVVAADIRADRAELLRLVGNGFDGVDPAGVEVRIDRARGPRESFTGRAHGRRPPRLASRPDTRFLVHLRIPGVLRNRAYPKTYRYPRRRTAPAITVRDWRERLLTLVAHEAFHVHQFRTGLRRSEVTAERWALATLERWRTAEPHVTKAGERPQPVQTSLLDLLGAPLLGYFP
jgi:hypothetical protein